MKPKYVRITWDDHSIHLGAHKPRKVGLSQQVSVGFLVHEDDGVFKLAQTRTKHSNGKKEWNDFLIIGRAMVSEVKELT